MTPLDFLEMVWPDAGHYALATPFTPKGSTTSVYAHKVFSSFTDAAAYVERNKTKLDLFFCVHSLKSPKLWNPNKLDLRTGEKGAFEVRTQRNTLQAKAFFFDLDVGEGLKKYATRKEALEGLIRFCKDTQLPKPLITSSGRGMHVYWILDEALDSDTWRTHASKLRQLAQYHSLKVDPARTTDTASVLRVAGTFNFKNREAPKPVEVVSIGAPNPTVAFVKLLDSAIIRAGVTAKPTATTQPALNSPFGTNLTIEFDGPPVAFKSLVAACAQMPAIVRSRGKVSEPQWYHSINLVRFVENGRKFAHRLSDQHPDYSVEATDAKLDQLEAKAIKPTSCARMATEFGDAICEGCPFFGKVKSPIVAARYHDTAPEPVVVSKVDTINLTTTIPDPPKPYKRLSNGHIALTTKNKDGDEMTVIIYKNDLYPIRRLSNEHAKLEQQTWRVTLPFRGTKDFMLDADALYDRRKFVTTVSNQGIYPESGNIQNLQDYMIAYISELQQIGRAHV